MTQEQKKLKQYIEENEVNIDRLCEDYRQGSLMKNWATMCIKVTDNEEQAKVSFDLIIKGMQDMEEAIRKIKEIVVDAQEHGIAATYEFKTEKVSEGTKYEYEVTSVEVIAYTE